MTPFEFQAALVHSSADAIVGIDLRGVILCWNTAATRMFGHQRTEVMGQSVALLFPQKHARTFQLWLRTLTQGGELPVMETNHCHKDGSLLPASVSVSPVRDVDGVLVGLSETVRRVPHPDDRRFHAAALEDEQRLRASEAFLDRTGRVAKVGGWEVDLEAQYVTWSDETCRIHELSPGHSPSLEEALNFYTPDSRIRLREAIDQSIAHGHPWDLELSMVTAKGRTIWVRAVGEAESREGQVVGLIGAVQDITESQNRKAELRREQQLRVQIERHAAELNLLLEERREMIDVLAHEVRQPLNNASAALQSAAQALTEVSDHAARLRLSKAQTVLGQVMGRIDNTLATAALLAKQGPLERHDTDVDMLLSVCIADMPSIERDRIRIDRSTSTRTAAMDPGLMRLALRNLLSNALKYAPANTAVTLRVADSDDPLALVIDVNDLGHGIEPDFIPHLFERGSRGRAGKMQPGHGLGLHIVRKVMELHGGRVALMQGQDAGDGTTFRLLVPQATGDDVG